MKKTYMWVGGVVIVVLIAGALLHADRKSRTGGSIMGSGSWSQGLSLTSSAFANDGAIPQMYTCDITPPGTNFPLVISGVQSGAQSLALIMDDPDVPAQVLAAGVYDHWVLFNIPPNTTAINASSTVGTVGSNGSGIDAYAAPCPPATNKPFEHRYILTLYALDEQLPLKAGATKQQVIDAMEGHIIGQTALIGRYKSVKAQ